MKNAKKPNTKRVEEFLDKIDWFFDINNFERRIYLKDEAEDCPAAEVRLDEEYQRVSIKLYPEFFKLSLESQRKALLHELCHIFTIPLSKSAHDLLEGKLVTQNEVFFQNERATSRITNAIDKLFRNHGAYAKKAYADYLGKPVKKLKRKRKK